MAVLGCSAGVWRGIPDILISDNEPQFSSDIFCKFAAEYQFQHQTSSPHYPRSNGKAEKAVQTIKNLLRKAQVEKSDFHLALLDFRNSPTNDNVGSPAQRLMGRRTKTLLPTAKKLLLPKTIAPTAVSADRHLQQERQKRSYNRSSTLLSPLEVGDQVRYKSGNIWQRAVVIGTSNQPRSFIIQSADGQTYNRRSRKHLPPDSSRDDDDDDLHSEDGEEHLGNTPATNCSNPNPHSCYSTPCPRVHNFPSTIKMHNSKTPQLC